MFRRDNVVILNDKADQVKKLSLKKSDNTFNFKNKKYLIDRKEDAYIKVKGLLKDYRYYVYNINNIRPLTLTAEHPKFDTEQLNIMLETKVLHDLNKVKSNFKLDWKIIVVALIVIGVIIYFLQGGTLR